jgi:tripeptidyl-peptidase-1
VLYLEDDPNPPLVNSASFVSEEDSHPVSDLDTFNTEAMKLGLRGVTLVSGSGDQGVTGPNNTIAGCGYTPLFPTTCPYVVSVGGTQGQEEVVCQANKRGIITSGGGFSNYYPQPSYQTENVQQYFAQTSPYSDPSVPSQTYNRSNRGYPDVSAQAVFYSVMIGGVNLNVAIAGTSASTPVVAGMFSLINAARKIAGQSPLGFVQPLLYSQGAAFMKDIVIGNNSCLAVTDILAEALCCPVQGYTAQPGWDPTTGLGSINFQNFYNTAVTTSSSGSNITAGQRVAVGISIAVICVMFISALIFTLNIQLPLPAWMRQYCKFGAPQHVSAIKTDVVEDIEEPPSNNKKQDVRPSIGMKPIRGRQH